MQWRLPLQLPAPRMRALPPLWATSSSFEELRRCRAASSVLLCAMLRIQRCSRRRGACMHLRIPMHPSRAAAAHLLANAHNHRDPLPLCVQKGALQSRCTLGDGGGVGCAEQKIFNALQEGLLSTFVYLPMRFMYL